MTGGAPYRISDREVPIDITGYLMPTRAPNAPVLIRIPGTDDLFIVLFSTREKLSEQMTVFGIEYARVSIVTCESDLIDEVRKMNAGGRPYRIRLAIDPHRATNGRVRFIEAQLLEAWPDEVYAQPVAQRHDVPGRSLPPRHGRVKKDARQLN